MYTFNRFTTDRKNLESRRRELVAEFIDGENTHTQEFQFSINEKPEVIKKRISDYLNDEVNAVPEPITDITVVEEVPAEPTPEEQARTHWLEQWGIYEKANNAMKALSEAGIEPTVEETDRFNTLKTWVAENRKPEYSQFM